MEREEIKSAFNELNPTEEQTTKMWERLSQSNELKNQKKKRSKFRKVRYIAAAAIGILVVSVSAVGINAAAEGKLLSMVKETLGMSETRQDIVAQTQEIQSRGIEVYASDIMYIDDDLLIFGNLRGVIIYNRQKLELLGTIDTQAIDCMYFNADTKQTHLIKQADSLIIFNSEKNAPFGTYYQFMLTDGTNLELSPTASGTDKKMLKEYYAEWKRVSKNYIDTFDRFHDQGIGEENKDDLNKETSMYSEQSLKWTNANKEEQISYLTVEKNQYILNTYQSKTGTIALEILHFSNTSGETQTEPVLPKFVYTGEDMQIKAICEYLQEENGSYLKEGEVWVPGFNIYKQVTKNNEFLVFGNFWSYYYLQNGSILESEGGGEMPACFHLKLENGSYTVVSVDTTGDGSEYEKGIREFTRGYFGLFSKYMNKTDEDRDAACKEYLQMYVKENNLSITHYKEFGWNPVKLF